MNIKEEKIIKAIKYELLGMCLDTELEATINFSKKDICEKLYKKYNFIESEINTALKAIKKSSTDAYLYPFEFNYKKYIEDSNIVPLNKIIEIAEYFLKNLNIENPQKNFYIGYSMLSELLHPYCEITYEAYRQKALSLLSGSEIEECKKLYKKYNEITVEIIKKRVKNISSKDYKEIIKNFEEIFLT